MAGGLPPRYSGIGRKKIYLRITSIMHRQLLDLQDKTGRYTSVQQQIREILEERLSRDIPSGTKQDPPTQLETTSSSGNGTRTAQGISPKNPIHAGCKSNGFPCDTQDQEAV